MDDTTTQQIASRDDEIKRLKAVNSKLEAAAGKTRRDDTEIAQLRRKLKQSQQANEWLRQRNDKVLTNFRRLLDDKTDAQRAVEDAEMEVRALRLALSKYTKLAPEPSEGATRVEQHIRTCEVDPTHGSYGGDYCPMCNPPPEEDDDL